MTELRIITAFCLALFGAVAAFMNWRCVVLSMRNKRNGINKHYSIVPLLSLITCGLAYLICPIEPRVWVWAVPVLDPGNWILAVGLPVAVARGAFRGKEGNAE